jgi:hypothetical protein
VTVPDLRTISGVELIKVGRWNLSTGPWTVTPELLAAAAASHRSGTLPRPIVKLGHVDDRFDGEPALGLVENIALSDDGRTLTGDLVGVPAWLTDIAASAYPRRSIEGVHDLEMADGTLHRFVITAVALLGATRPGIGTLADIQSLYGVAASAGSAVIFRVNPENSALQQNSPTTTRQRVQIRAAASRRRHRRAQAALDLIEGNS